VLALLALLLVAFLVALLLLAVQLLVALLMLALGRAPHLLLPLDCQCMSTMVSLSVGGLLVALEGGQAVHLMALEGGQAVHLMALEGGQAVHLMALEGGQAVHLMALEGRQAVHLMPLEGGQLGRSLLRRKEGQPGRRPVGLLSSAAVSSRPEVRRQLLRQVFCVQTRQQLELPSLHTILLRQHISLYTKTPMPRVLLEVAPSLHSQANTLMARLDPLVLVVEIVVADVVDPLLL
jgi:hypothetical protein